MTDCTYYNDKRCPKQLEIIKKKIRKDNLNILMVGCWGVYCWEDKVTLEEYKPPGKGNNKGKFKITEKMYGQKNVVRGMVKYTRKYPTESVFLAGDNVYNYNIPKEKLKKMVTVGIYPNKKTYKEDHTISAQRIQRQLSDGFLYCFDNVNVKDFYIAIGNHDIQNCFDLNNQLRFSRDHIYSKYRLPAVYYNTVYQMNDYNVNILVIDTNMYDGNDPKTCSGVLYTENDRNNQKKWVLQTLQRNNARWNIIVGHIPYKANPHKQKIKKDSNGNIIKKGPDYILNSGLDDLFKTINNCPNCPKVQVYMCADEHNQQFLVDKENKMGLVVAGSGGTALDKNIIKGKYWESTYWYNPFFGFVAFNFTPNFLKLTYFVTDRDYGDNSGQVTPAFQAVISQNGIFINKEL